MLAIALMASIGARVLFDNSRLRISDMRLAPGEAGGVEAHEFPTLRWQVGDGAHRRLHAGKEEEPATVADKATFWVEPGEPFRVLNCGKGEYRQICWEFKSPPRYTEEVVRKMLTEAKFTTDVGTALLFENSYCRAWDFCLAPGEDHSLEPHHHILDYAFVYVAKGESPSDRDFQHPNSPLAPSTFPYHTVRPASWIQCRRQTWVFRLHQRGRRCYVVRYPRRGWY